MRERITVNLKNHSTPSSPPFPSSVPRIPNRCSNRCQTRTHLHASPFVPYSAKTVHSSRKTRTTVLFANGSFFFMARETRSSSSLSLGEDADRIDAVSSLQQSAYEKALVDSTRAPIHFPWILLLRRCLLLRLCVTLFALLRSRFAGRGLDDCRLSGSLRRFRCHRFAINRRLQMCFLPK